MLSRVQSPSDINNISEAERRALCADLRAFILRTVENNGGHLASNLGVIELTVALHTVFDTSVDRIVWDVGHQCYAHKILTGRKDAFDTIRQYGGLSGFPKGKESVHDAFDTGHASTAISAALGLARARDLLCEHHSVIAVVGDGALTGGMCYEALNDAGQSKTGILVILNDNAMAISKSVGGMTSYLSKLRASPGYLRFKRRLKRTLNAIPGIGKGLARFAEGFKDRVKFFVLPRVFFEEIGFTYLGPFDGHDLPGLIEVLGDVKHLDRPVFLHLITRKGKGYPPAEKDPEHYHGLGASNGGKSAATLPSNGSIAGNALCNLAKDDPRVVAITAAMTAGTGLPWFARQYPERFFDVAIAEQHAVTLAAGMAKGGLRPYVALYSTFLQRAYDQIVHDVCMPNLPVTFLIDRAGLVGADGETHHGVFDLAMLLPLPNMQIYSPASQRELLAAIERAHSAQGPVAIRYPRATLPPGEDGDGDPERWRAVEPLQRVVILSTGAMCALAREAHNLLQREDWACGLVEACRVKPLDEKMLDALKKTCDVVITMEDGCTAGGFGAAVSQWAHRNGAFRVICLGMPDAFIPHGSVGELMAEIGLSARDVADRVRAAGEQHG